jgi:glutamine amidotransferase
VHQGIGVLSGRVVRLPDGTAAGRVKVPHVGWSELHPPAGGEWSSTLLSGLELQAAMYFVHSYVPEPMLPGVVKATMTYGGAEHCAVVEDGNVVGVQFHPEKSAAAGLHLLGNFMSRS